MPLLLRLVAMLALAYIAGSTITPLLWGPVLVQQSKDILSPFVMLSAAILVFAVAYAIGQWKKRT